MSGSLAKSCLVILLLFAGCVSKSNSELTKVLNSAVADRKLSEKKMKNILNEYEMLVESDKAKAREYAAKLIKAIEMGADSSHLEVVRKEVMGVQRGA